MFILKSFFAEPMAILRSFGNGSATGRVLALITAMAGAVLIALQPVQAQEADFYATLYEKEDGDDAIMLTFGQTLGTGRAPNESDQNSLIVFTPKYRGLASIQKWEGNHQITPTGSAFDPSPNLAAPSVANITTTGAGRTTQRLEAATTRIVIHLSADHSFKAGDILTFVSAKFASDNNNAFEEGRWNVQFTAGLEELSWGSDESLYTIGVPELENDMEYPISGVPGGSDGIGDVSYAFASGSSIERDNGLSHVTGRNVLRVSSNTTAPMAPENGCSGHYCLTGYTATDGNGASIQRIIVVFIVEQLHSDDVASGIPALQQQVEGGAAVYAKEMFGADSANLVLLRGKYGSIGLASSNFVVESSIESTGFFVLQFRKPVDTENSGRITLTLHGAALGDVMAPSHVKVIRESGDNNSRGLEIANVTVQRRQGGNVGDNQVVFQIATGSTDAINIGDYIRFEIPALMGTNLGNDEMVFISATASSVSKSGQNNFPDGADGVSKCLSERIAGARECILAKAAEAVMVEVEGYENRAKINVSDRTRAAGPERGTPNISVTLTPEAISGLRSNRSANVFDLGKAHISIVYGTKIHVRGRDDTSFPPVRGTEYVPIFNASGEIFASNSVSPNDFFHLRVTPIPSHGALVAAEYEGGSHKQELQAVQQASYQGRIQDVMDKDGQDGKKTLIKSLLYVPSGAIDSTGATSLEHGEIYNMTASVDFNNASFEDKTSNPNTTAFELSSVESKAIAYAIPPPSSPDDAFIRIRCENSSGCDVSLRCSNQTGAAWFGELSGRVNHNATEVLTAEEIADILSGEGFDASRHWGGPSNGRLSCEVMTRGGAVSTQVLVRSGGILTNNTNVSMGGTPGS